MVQWPLFKPWNTYSFVGKKIFFLNINKFRKIFFPKVDFDGYIIAFLTNNQGRAHDSLISTYNHFFHEILGNRFTLGDSAFSGTSTVIGSFKPSQVKTPQKRVFDRITRREQILIEHVNCWVKSSATLSRGSRFTHGEDKLNMCVFIVCGLYNMRRRSGSFQ